MIFPFIDPQVVIDDGELGNREVPLAREWAWNFERDEFDLKNGKMYIVEGNEAIKIWIYKILKTERFKYLIYDHDYGNDLYDYVGRTGTQAYIRSEIKRVVEEAILSTLEDYVLELRNHLVSIKYDGVFIDFNAHTIYDDEDDRGVDINDFQIYTANR